MSWRYAPWSTRLVRFQKPVAGLPEVCCGWFCGVCLCVWFCGFVVLWFVRGRVVTAWLLACVCGFVVVPVNSCD